MLAVKLETTNKPAKPPKNHPETSQIPNKSPTNQPKITLFFSWRHFVWTATFSLPIPREKRKRCISLMFLLDFAFHLLQCKVQYRNIWKTHYFLSVKNPNLRYEHQALTQPNKCRWRTDVEILPACQEAKSSNQAIVTSSSLSSLNQQVADPDSSFSNTANTTRYLPQTKKTYHAEDLVDRTIVKLTKEITKLKDVLCLELVTNPDEICATLKFKKNELNTAIKKKNQNHQNKKLSCHQQMAKYITDNYIFSRIMFESWIIWGWWNKWVGQGGSWGLW